MELAAVAWAAAHSFIGFEILALDTAVASAAQRAVQFVVVLGAVGLVLEDVEVCRLEWNTAVAACEAIAMVTARKSTICR